MVSENMLRHVRTVQGLSQLELSARTRISPGVISNLENGKLFAYPGWRKRIAMALGVPEERIFPEVANDGGKSNSHG